MQESLEKQIFQATSYLNNPTPEHRQEFINGSALLVQSLRDPYVAGGDVEYFKAASVLAVLTAIWLFRCFQMNEFLVLVHPGSACGSANDNIGKWAANGARDGLVMELDNWRGSVIVLETDLSDEIVNYPLLDQAINNALQRAKADGLVSLRLMGEDPQQKDFIRDFVNTLTPEQKKTATFEVTGAWFYREDGGGCVGGVYDALIAMGCQANVSEYALCEDELVDEIDEGIDDEDAPSPSRPIKP